MNWYRKTKIYHIYVKWNWYRKRCCWIIQCPFNVLHIILYCKSHWTKYRLVCTHCEAFYMQILAFIFSNIMWHRNIEVFSNYIWGKCFFFLSYTYGLKQNVYKVCHVFNNITCLCDKDIKTVKGTNKSMFVTNGICLKGTKKNKCLWWMAFVYIMTVTVVLSTEDDFWLFGIWSVMHNCVSVNQYTYIQVMYVSCLFINRICLLIEMKCYVCELLMFCKTWAVKGDNRFDLFVCGCECFMLSTEDMNYYTFWMLFN